MDCIGEHQSEIFQAEVRCTADDGLKRLRRVGPEETRPRLFFALQCYRAGNIYSGRQCVASSREEDSASSFLRSAAEGLDDGPGIISSAVAGCSEVFDVVSR